MAKMRKTNLKLQLLLKSYIIPLSCIMKLNPLGREFYSISI